MMHSHLSQLMKLAGPSEWQGNPAGTIAVLAAMVPSEVE